MRTYLINVAVLTGSSFSYAHPSDPTPVYLAHPIYTHITSTGVAVTKSELKIRNVSAGVSSAV